MDYYSWQEFLKIDKSLFNIIITLGDVDIMFLKSLKKNFADKRVVGIHGNHDYLGDLEHFGIENIHGKTVKIDDIKISGLEGCLNYKNHPLLHTDEEIVDVISKLDTNSDIIISHNSPLGVHDGENITHRGYLGLREYIEKYQPKYCVHGHQHINETTKVDNTTIISVYGGTILDLENGEINHVLKILH